MRCLHCHRNFRDRKALLCHMNHPLGSCHSHHQEVVNLVDELQRYQGRRHQHRPTPPVTPEPMDLDATLVEDFQEDVQDVDPGPFVQEYEGAAKEYGRGATFMQKFDCDQYAQERQTNLFYPFASRDEWELAAFLLRSDLSMASINSLLSLKLVRVTYCLESRPILTTPGIDW